MVSEKLYRANIPSCETEEDTKINILKLYRTRSATRDKEGRQKLAAPVKFLEADAVLSTHPKFSIDIRGGSASSAADYRVTIASSDKTSRNTLQITGTRLNVNRDVCNREPSVGGIIDINAPSRARPKGIKRQRADDAAEAGTYKIAKSIDRVSLAIETSTVAKLKASSVSMKYKIIKSLPMNENEKAHELLKLLLVASSLDKSGQHDEKKSSSGHPSQSLGESE